MGVQLVDIGVQLRKVMIFSIRACSKTVCNHPFLVGLLCFLALLYRSFPFVFSVLVSVSPVLVCTAVLLGTLLSFGNPNIPEIEREERTVHDIVPLRTGILQDATVYEGDESYYVDRYTTKERDLVDQSIDGLSLSINELCEVERGTSFGDDVPLIENRSRKIELESRMFLEEGRDLYDSGSEKKNEKNEERFDDDGEMLEHQYSPIPNMDDENLEFENEKSVDSFDSRMVNVGSPSIDRDSLEHQYSPVPNMDNEILEFDNDKSVDSFDSKTVNFDSPPGSPLKQEEQEEEEYDDDDDGSFDSDSDRAESSSPDASMADIIPMLDELHPLLDEETPQHINLSHDGSDAASEHSNSCDGDQESDDGSENPELEPADYQNGDGKETTKDKQENPESAITWTEEDQKNLRDLGSLELERNQRLESLIARRRARKNMRTMAEKNLIDLESSDFPFKIPPISTARKNPFDLPDDHYDNLGLPPIPGSAPSILQPRRNPFDLPYDSGEEKPDLKEDSFQQEFKTSHAKESFFWRHESFNVRPSLFGRTKQETHDIHLRPYFIPEHTDSEGTSYSRFQRQSSEVSIPETESTCSGIDLEDKNLIKEETEDKSTEENHHEVGPSMIEEGYVGEALDLAATEIHSKSETFERCSSNSSLSEAGEKIFDENETRWLSDLGERRDHSENMVIYDLSPTSSKEISSSSIAPDVKIRQEIETSTPITEEMLANSQPVEDSVKNYEVSNLQSLFESQPVGENLIDMEVASLQLENNRDHLSNLDANTDYGPLSEAFKRPISPRYQCGSAEKSFPQSDEDSFKEQPVIMMESVEEESSTSNSNFPEIRGLDGDAQPVTASPSSPTFASILHQVDEATSHAGQSDINGSILDEVQNDNHIDASESHKYFTEAIEFHENVPYIVEDDTDGIEEIDEGILSELDAVGDFSIKESVSSLNEFESGVSLPALHNAGLFTTRFLEEDPIYVHEKIFSVHSENLNESMVEHEYKNEEKCGSEISTPGISLMKDVDSCSTEFAEKEIQESMDEKSAEEVSQLNQNSNTEEDIDSGMPIVEASSLKDLESIHEQATLNSTETDMVSELPQEVQLEADTDSGMPVLLAQSIQDLDSVFKQIGSEENEKQDLLDLEQSSLFKSEIQFEARPTEDTDLDHMQLHDSDVERYNLQDSVGKDADTIESLHVGPTSHEYGTETDLALEEPELEENKEKPMKSSSQDESIEDCDVPENSKDGTKKVDFGVEESVHSELATFAENDDREAPKVESWKMVDVKAEKEDFQKPGSSSSDSHKE